MAWAEKAKGSLRGLLPQHAANGAVWGFMELLRALHRPFAPRRAAPEAAETQGALIEDQRSYGDTPYGRTTIRRAGCEVIAVYNALLALTGTAPPLDALARVFERDGMALAGLFGTAPGAARDYLRARGFPVTCTRRAQEADALAAACTVAILTLWNDRRDVAAGIHTVCCTRDARGWIAHNVSGTGYIAPPAATLRALVETLWGGRGRLISLLAVGAREKKGISVN